MTTSEQQRYTLEEARQLLAEQECREDGHEFEQIRDRAWNIVRALCTRCGASFEPTKR